MRFTYSVGQRCNTINVPPIRQKCIATVQHAILFIVIGKNGSSRKPVGVVPSVQYGHGTLPNPSSIASSIGQWSPKRNFCKEKIIELHSRERTSCFEKERNVMQETNNVRVLQVLWTNSSSVRFSKDTNVILLSMHNIVWSAWFFCGWEFNQGDRLDNEGAIKKF